jgi:hypothetical protein
MNIHWRLKSGGALPKSFLPIGIKINPIGVAVYQGSLKPDITNCTFEFVSGFGGILHGKMRKAAKSLWLLGNLMGKVIVGSSCAAYGQHDIGFNLNTGSRDRQHRKIDAGIIHCIKTQSTKIQQPWYRTIRKGSVYILVGICEIVRKLPNDKMLFEGSFPDIDHGFSYIVLESNNV